MRFSCPTCKQIIQVADDVVGQVIACPNCRQRLKVPTPIAPGAAKAAPVDKTLLGKEEPSPIRASSSPRAPAPEVPLAPEPVSTGGIPPEPEPPEPDIRRRQRGRDDWDDRDDYRDRGPRDRGRGPEEEPVGLAIAGMVCGIIGLLTFWFICLGVICGLLGVIFGGISLGGHHHKGRGMAITGVVTGALALLLGVAMLIFFAVSTNNRAMFH